ncbi:MAG TPA: hypothetical protein VGF13_17735 [Verrucomicrobiae bacterium]|jgi:hypothetical protein
MKTLLKHFGGICVLGILCGQVAIFRASAAENMTAPEAILAQVRASTNAQQAALLSFKLEELWPRHPKAYFEGMGHVAGILAGAPGADASSSTALKRVFGALTQKQCPADVSQATVCINSKRESVLRCFNSENIRNDQSSWIQLAKFIGEVRARRIPNYLNRGASPPMAAFEILMKANVSHPNFLNAERRRAYDKAMEAGAEIRNMDTFQTELFTTDSVLTFQLLENVSHLATSDSKADFVKEISSVAKLSAEEQQRLK